MKKLILVTFIGIVLGMNIYGIINEIQSYFEVEEAEELTYEIVYME